MSSFSEPMLSSPLNRETGSISPDRVSQRVEMQPQFPATRGRQSSKLCDPLRLDSWRDKVSIWVYLTFETSCEEEYGFSVGWISSSVK